MISYKERQYLCWFLSVPGIGAVTGMRLFKQFKSFEKIYNIEGKEVEKPTAGVYIIKQLLSNGKIRFHKVFLK